MAKNKIQARSKKLQKKAVAAGAKKLLARAVKALSKPSAGPAKSSKPSGKKEAPKKLAAPVKPAPKAAAVASAKKTAAAPAKPAPKAAAPVKGAKAAPSEKTLAQKVPAAAVAKPAKTATPKQMKKPASLRASAVDAEQVCREVACEGLSTTAGYCRLHYIKNWKKIKRKELILKEGKLNQYIEELVAKYPDKYIEAIRQDLASDKDFAKVIYDLDLDEGIDDFEVEGESVDNLIDTIKRDFDDEGEGGF